LSPGQKQRVNWARALIHAPPVVLLDEPTLGLDVGASRDARKLIREWMDADKNRALLLTTHYMVEAEELCDRVAIINKGRVLACDTPANLKRNLQRDAIFEIETSPLNGLTDKMLGEQSKVRKAALTEIEGGAKLELILEEESALASIINILDPDVIVLGGGMSNIDRLYLLRRDLLRLRNAAAPLLDVCQRLAKPGEPARTENRELRTAVSTFGS